MPQTPIGQFQTAFKLPHLNATFPSTFRIYKNLKHLKKVWAPTRTVLVVVVVATTSRELKRRRRRRRKFVHPLTALIFIAKTQL